MKISHNSQLYPLLDSYIVVREMKNEESFLQDQFLNVPLQVQDAENKEGAFVLVNTQKESWRYTNKILPVMPLEIEVVAYK